MTTAAARLNRDCHCRTVDQARLAAALGLRDDPLALGELLTTHPHLFADSAVFLAAEEFAAMAAVVAAVERVVQLPAWQARCQARHGLAAPPNAARGMFLGFDFHPGAAGPQLIEINTNAGGALLNVALREAQVACCDDAAMRLPAFADGAALVAMFRREWQLARGEAPLRRVAIVDDAPAAQYLYPEFSRFVTLLARHGIAADILDPGELSLQGGRLQARGETIDLVYNRLTDFLLAEPRHAVLAQAYREDLAVVSPHPHAWAQYADKHNLVLLTDPAALRELGAAEADIALLQAGIPRTVAVTDDNAAALWAARGQWFFKPAAGYGSKAAYRGDKLTRGKWQEILAAGDYVAQALVPPGERRILVDGELRALKVDLRNYAWEGRVQLVSARLYQGQTTNFRTAGGGFAAVFLAG